ncbi:MAG: mercuric reductase [Deltaproteobacteria bacterium]|nr:mercuric reductase [Deltaproteobacteria bacterium]
MRPTDTAEPLTPWDEHNQTLWSHVHPEDWTDPPPEGRYNLVVLGAGTAGLIAAAGAAGLGAKVALIEKHMMGGDCLNTGCVPSKALIRAARAAADVRDAASFGVELSGELPKVDFSKVMERMRRLRADISHHDSAGRFRDLGVDVFLGAGTFVAQDAIEVNGTRLHFAKAVIATGARAFVPPIPGLAAAGFLTNESVFSLTDLPPRLGVIGAGPIGCELAQSFARFGAEVHLVELDHRVLPHEDPEASALVHASLSRDGVQLHVAHELTRVQNSGDHPVLHLSGDEDQEVEVDAILLAIGRAANTEHLGLDAAGVKVHPKGIEVDDHLRTSNPRVFAAGDVAQPFHFTHAADHTARIVIRNALFGGRQRLSALNMPRATYTAPEVAHVGWTVADLEGRGIEYRTFTQDFASVDRCILDGETEGFARVHIAANSDRIFGATVVGKNAGNLISEVSVAMAGGMGLGSLASVIHPYPTQAEVFPKLGSQFMRTRLTPMVAKGMDAWLSFTR